MNKLLLAAGMVLLLASVVYAQTDASLDVHNFSIQYGGVGASVAQGCRGCHIPHGGSIKTDSANPSRTTVFGSGVDDPSTGVYKLWDKNLSSWSGLTYSSDNVTGEFLQEPASSLSVVWHTYLCFSCHDGAAASLNLQPTTFGDPYDFLVNSTFPQNSGDTDLTNDHPVDIQWPTGDTTDYDTVINVAGATNSATTGGTIFGTGGTRWSSNVQALPLYGVNANVECATCHNPHKQVPSASITGMGTTRGNFLRMNSIVNNTDFCRECHLSKR